MRKVLCILLALLAMLFCLSACSDDSESTYTYSSFYNSKEILLTVDPLNGTMTDGKDIYHYTITDGTHIDITYPNGATYWSTHKPSNGTIHIVSGWSDDYDRHRYIDGSVLEDALEQQLESHSSSIGIGWCLLLLGSGLFSLLYPELSWFLSYGWRYKNTEPSKLALISARVSGAVIILLAVILLFLR